MSTGTALDCFGCDDPDYVGFDMSSLGPLFQAAGGMASGAITDYEADEKKKAASAADKKAAEGAAAADNNAALAVAKALTSERLKQPSAAIDRVAASNAVTAADKAGAGLSAAGSELRAKAADDALNAAIKKAQAAPKDVYPQALVEAWTGLSNKAHSGNIVVQGASQGQSSPSWFTRPVVGPVPGWGVLGIGAVVATGIGVAVKKFFF